MTTTRSTVTRIETVARHVAKPLGAARENGPHLSDLRAFVEACEGMPDEARVHIDAGPLGESGRREVTFTARHSVEVSP